MPGRHFRRRAGCAARHADPDHHRRPAVGHRHRRHGPAGALQRARHVGARRGGRGRRRHAAARQDRHHHLRQPPGDRDHSRARRHRARGGGSRAACEPCRRDAGRPLDRRAGAGEIRHPSPSARARRSFIEFSATTRLSGVDHRTAASCARAPSTAVLEFARDQAGQDGRRAAGASAPRSTRIARSGGTPLGACRRTTACSASSTSRTS